MPSPTGTLAPTSAAAADIIQGGTDTTVSANGRALSVRLPGGLISSWAIGRNGSLRDLGTTQGAAAFGSAGLVAG